MANVNTKNILGFVISLLVFICSVVFCLLNPKPIKLVIADILHPDQFTVNHLFQTTTILDSPRLAKYQIDGNVYVIDSGMFRLICMRPDGNINWAINIDRLNEYIKFIDLAVDEKGNVYVLRKEFEHDAYLTKRDFISKYDKNGKFIENIFVENYNAESEDRPHAFPQYGSVFYEDGILTFARTMKDRVVLYAYDTHRERLDTKTFYPGTDGYTVARLAIKDMNNFAYTTRGGDIFEVVNGGEPKLRVSFNWSESDGGTIPWFIEYNEADLVFWDMTSGRINRITKDNFVSSVLPEDFFKEKEADGEVAGFSGFGSFKEHYAGEFGGSLWLYDGSKVTTLQDELKLPQSQRLQIMAVQLSFVLSIISLVFSCFFLFVRILDGYVSLFVKQVVIIIPLVIIAFFILYEITFRSMLERINTETFHELSLAVNIAAERINGDELETLNSIKDYQSDAYKKINATVKDFIGDNRNEWGKAFYASLYKGVKRWYYVCVSDEEINLFRTTFVILPDEEIEFYKSRKMDSGVFENADGLWAYTNRAVFNSKGEMVGVLEIGIDMNSYQISNANQGKKTAEIAALICAIILAALIIVISVIIRQLAAVANVLHKIGSGEYSARVNYRGRDELGKVTHGFNSMASELERQISHITNMNNCTIRFVPVQFMEYLKVSDITKLKLGSSVQHGFTILFFDIRSFSVNSELMSVTENFKFINAVLDVSGPIIRKYNGFVDKYMGDAAMALFPRATDGVMAGIEIYRNVVLNKRTKIKVGLDGINIGVGLHTGLVSLGIIGENERLSGTVISKNVNLASRMESLTKQVRAGMLITSATFNSMSDSERTFTYRFIGMVRVAGVNEITGVFDILDALPENVRKRRLATKLIFESGIRLYHTKHYRNAEKRFLETLKIDPSDLCASICLEETRDRIKNPDLQSVFIFDKK
ncbi:hypothetical protein FACS1894102_3520 [Spirochaetia bacterium]|nr:hypothetical protein FACS1894102_3520 [Spirochaetia bacterium]